MTDHYTRSISLLRAHDIKEAVQLSTQAGWNQTDADWARLLELNPESCFLLRLDGRIAATSTLATFDTELAWVGMVIVDLSHRGKGIGTCMLEKAIRTGQQMGYKIIGLDATEQGRRLYRHYGFHDIKPIDRWAGKIRPAGPGNDVHLLEERHVHDVVELDLQWCGYDRRKLIQRFFHEKTIQGLGISRDGRLQGFAFLRPGRQFHHLGPLLAATNEDFTNLLDAATHALHGQSVLVDALRREETSILLKERGLTIQRQLMRMTLNEGRKIFNNPELRIAVSFEWG
ncbi:MAG: GNAT family N-acetyltransferase [Balneolales bacterium]